MKIKLSHDAEKVVKKLEEIKSLTKEFKELFEKLEGNEQSLVGGLLIAIYSPLSEGTRGLVAAIAHKIIGDGLMKDLIKKMEED